MIDVTHSLDAKGLKAAINDFQSRTGGFGADDDYTAIEAAVRAYISALPSQEVEAVAGEEAYWLRKNAVLVRELGSSMTGALAAAMERRADTLDANAPHAVPS